MSEEMCHTQFRILRYVYRNPHCSSDVIAEALGLKRRTVTDWLKKMRESELLKRTKMLSNMKTWFNYLTEKGRNVYVSEACRKGVLGTNEL
jgi:DNA-binding MarR family transcriptional regulator